jgi:hypothetical protein
MKDPQRNNNFDRLEVFKEGKDIVIRKMSKFLGVIFLNRRETKRLHTKLGSVLGIIDWKKRLEEDKKKYLW